MHLLRDHRLVIARRDEKRIHDEIDQHQFCLSLTARVTHPHNRRLRNRLLLDCLKSDWPTVPIDRGVRPKQHTSRADRVNDGVCAPAKQITTPNLI